MKKVCISYSSFEVFVVQLIAAFYEVFGYIAGLFIVDIDRENRRVTVKLD